MKPTRVIVPVPLDVALAYDGRSWQLVPVPAEWSIDGWDCDAADSWNVGMLDMGVQRWIGTTR